jgi:hypothetical protein
MAEILTEPEASIDADRFSNTIFEASRWLARAGWLILVASLFLPETRPWAWPTAQFVVPALFCLGYVLMVVTGRRGFAHYKLGTFFKLHKIGYLYTNPRALAASWLHFLALDLFAGAWMVQDGLAIGMRLWLILLCLPFTLMLGPVGLLLYIVLRFTTVA